MALKLALKGCQNGSKRENREEFSGIRAATKTLVNQGFAAEEFCCPIELRGRVLAATIGRLRAKMEVTAPGAVRIARAGHIREATKCILSPQGSWSAPIGGSR